MTEYTFFWAGPFSQWHKSDFVVDGVKYVTAEQFMMAEKARLFNDATTLALIMKTNNAKEQKRLGRLVTNFDADVWAANAKAIVYRGTYAKFTQNVALAGALDSTGSSTLVEASPYDQIWGIGLAAEDPLALDPATWNGLNWLGEIITKVREDIRTFRTYNVIS
jgi:ribA/ribD-fused uncharacterized protein